jgi:outer membrane biosynthesis protein TonB
MSNALEADAFVLFPGESIVAGTGAMENEVAEPVAVKAVNDQPSAVIVEKKEKPVVQKELSPKQKTAARKKEENKEKKRLKEEKNAKRKTDMQRRAQWKVGPECSSRFPLPRFAVRKRDER